MLLMREDQRVWKETKPYLIEIPLSNQRKRVSYQTLSTNRTLSTYFLNIWVSSSSCSEWCRPANCWHCCSRSCRIRISNCYHWWRHRSSSFTFLSNDTASVKNMYFMSDSKSGTKKNTIWKIDNTRTVLGEEVCKCLLLFMPFLDVTQHHIYTELEKVYFWKNVTKMKISDSLPVYFYNLK